MDEQQTDALVAIAFTTGHKSYSRGAIAQFPADKFAELKAQGFVIEAPAAEEVEESGRPPFGGGDASGLAPGGEAASPAPVSGGKRR